MSQECIVSEGKDIPDGEQKREVHVAQARLNGMEVIEEAREEAEERLLLKIDPLLLVHVRED